METWEQLEETLKELSIEVKNYSDVQTSKDALPYMKMKLAGVDITPIERREFKLKNDRYISVIRGTGTYGFEEGLFEVAVKDKNRRLDYKTKITKDVI